MLQFIVKTIICRIMGQTWDTMWIVAVWERRPACLTTAARKQSKKTQPCYETRDNNWPIGGIITVLCVSSMQVCLWWVEQSSTLWWVRSGCRRRPRSATPTSWRGWPSLWHWSADSSMWSWGSENEPSRPPSVPSYPMPNCKCHPPLQSIIVDAWVPVGATRSGREGGLTPKNLQTNTESTNTVSVSRCI